MNLPTSEWRFLTQAPRAGKLVFMGTGREYLASIGDRVLRITARNVWEAAQRAAIYFGSNYREGSDFFGGNAELALYRLRGEEPIFHGLVSKWRETFKAQGRTLRGRWAP